MGWLNLKTKFSRRIDGNSSERTIRIEAVDVKPTFNQPKTEIHELPRVDSDSVKARLDRLYREEHAGDSAPDTRLRTVKERLQEMKVKPKSVNLPLDSRREQVMVMERKEPSQENLVSSRIDKAMKRVEAVKQKMERTDSYLGLFYDLRAAEKEFLDSLDEANAKGIDLPETMQLKVESMKAKIKAPQK